MQALLIALSFLITSTFALSPSELPPLGQALDSGDPVRADKQISILLRRASRKEKSRLYYLRGTLALGQGDFIRAIKNLRLVVRSPGLQNAARVKMAQAFRQQGNLPAAKRNLEKIRSRQKNAVEESLYQIETRNLARAMLNQAIDRFERGDKAAAIRRVNEVGQFWSDPESLLVRGILYAKWKKESAARRDFRQVIRSKRSSPELKRRARSWLNRKSTDPWSADLTLAMGYDSNVFAQGKQEEIERLPVGSFNLGLTYRLAPPSRFIYRALLDEVLGRPAVRYLYHELSHHLTLGRKRWEIDFTQHLGHLAVGPLFVQLRPAIGVVARAVSGRLDIQGAYRLTRDISLDQTQGHLSGLSHRRSASLGWTVSRIYFQLKYLNRDVGGGDLDLSGNEILPLAYLGQGGRLDVEWTTGDRQATVGWMARYLYKEYKEGGIRKDREVSSGLSGKIRFAPGWQTFLSFTAIQNHSTFGDTSPADKNYFRWIGMTGVKWTNR